MEKITNTVQNVVNPLKQQKQLNQSSNATMGMHFPSTSINPPLQPIERSHKTLSQAENRAENYKAHVYNTLVLQKNKAGYSPPSATNAAVHNQPQLTGSAFRTFGATVAMRAGGTGNSSLLMQSSQGSVSGSRGNCTPLLSLPGNDLKYQTMQFFNTPGNKVIQNDLTMGSSLMPPQPSTFLHQPQPTGAAFRGGGPRHKSNA